MSVSSSAALALFALLLLASGNNDCSASSPSRTTLASSSSSSESNENAGTVNIGGTNAVTPTANALQDESQIEAVAVEADHGNVSASLADDDAPTEETNGTENAVDEPQNDAPQNSSMQQYAEGSGPQMVEENDNYTIEIIQPLLTNGQINKMSRQAAAMMTRATFKRVKQLFTVFAPDAWVEALNDIPLPTVRCLVRVGTKVSLLHQREMMRVRYNLTEEEGKPAAANSEGAEVPADITSDGTQNKEQPAATAQTDNGKVAGGEDVQLNVTAEHITKEEMMRKLKKGCPRGFAQVVALNEAINETMRELPPHVKSILEEYSTKLRNASAQTQQQEVNSTATQATVVALMEELKTVDAEEREQLSDLFPKLREVLTDPRINQLLDLGINCTNGVQGACRAASKFAMDIWKSANGPAIPFGSVAPKTLRAKREVEALDDVQLDLPDVNNETDDDGEEQVSK